MTDSNGRPRILGVCGGIGSGKSSACRTLVEELGCIGHIDSDRLAHTVYEPGPTSAIGDVVAEFGSSILQEGQQEAVIDRQKLGSIVFADDSAMNKLERIVWPHVRRKVQAKIEQLSNSWVANPKQFQHPVIVLEAAVLLDAGWQDDVDGVWVVCTSRDVALQRLQSSRGLSEEEATKRMDAQQSRRGIGNLQEEVSKGVVTAVLGNDGSAEDLRTALQSKLDDKSAWNPSDSLDR